MKTRLPLTALCLSGLILAGAAAAAAPDVTGLRSDIYSATAAELFWDRVPGQALAYEIMRGDGEVATTDGTSYFDSNRPAGVVEYTVTAIDSEGSRSDPAAISVGPFDQASLQPLQLRADVYSQTAAELFWLRAPGVGISYEVVRDDGLTATTQGNSFYDDTRTPGATNAYTVTAIDAQGVRQMPATLTVRAFGFESIMSPPATGVRAAVYSPVAAELFWERVPNRALRYEVLRDDGLSNVTNGTSFYDNKRLPGRSNSYLITTIDEEGNRSTPVSIDVPAG